jgi:hypothetical protein
VIPSKFIFLKIIPRDNFGELFRFFPKGLVHLTIQTKFKSCLVPEFVIQNRLEFEFVPNSKVVLFYLFYHPKKICNFSSSERVVLPFYKVALGENILI